MRNWFLTNITTLFLSNTTQHYIVSANIKVLFGVYNLFFFLNSDYFVAALIIIQLWC